MVQHHRKKLRLEGYNYNRPGDYFVTICTKNMVCYFGDVIDENIRLSEIGKIVDECWLDIPKHFKMIKLDKYVVMPNHIHGIVTIVNPVFPVVTADLRSLRSLRENDDIVHDRSKMLIPKIIQCFESTVTRIVHKKHENLPFVWQKSYYDHIIETDAALCDIREYIQLNPFNWENDSENLEYKKKLSILKKI